MLFGLVSPKWEIHNEDPILKVLALVFLYVILKLQNTLHRKVDRFVLGKRGPSQLATKRCILANFSLCPIYVTWWVLLEHPLLFTKMFAYPLGFRVSFKIISWYILAYKYRKYLVTDNWSSTKQAKQRLIAVQLSHSVLFQVEMKFISKIHCFQCNIGRVLKWFTTSSFKSFI